MESIQGKFELINGSGRISLENGEFANITDGQAIKVLHSLYGWVNGIYISEGETMTPQGAYQLQLGDTVKIQK